MEDYGFQSGSKNASPKGYQNKRSDSMTAASVVCGIIAATTPYFVFTSLICGPLAIIFGLLSKGGEQTTEARAKIGIVLGIIGLMLVTLIIILGMKVLIANAGGFEQLLEYYRDPSNPPVYPDTI